MYQFFSKGDYARAVLDFEKFLEVTPVDQYPEERRLAAEYIQTIRGETQSHHIIGAEESLSVE